MGNDIKLRILYLYQHLVQHTDAEHTLLTSVLLKILKKTTPTANTMMNLWYFWKPV